MILKVPVKVRCLEESNALDSEPQGPSMIEPLADDNWIAECSREVHDAEQRNQAYQNRFDNIEGLDTWYATHMNLSHSKLR